ncbi:alpha/beta hydrolase [Paenibacillus sp. P25]|nr:alpha/beta hydrolase [Paenibacillus sp. P25]
MLLTGAGRGQSPSPTEPPNYIDDVLSLMDHLQSPEAALIGHSMGGQIATELALNYPQRVTKLVLIGPSLSGFTHSKEFSEWMQETYEAAPDIERMMEISLSAPSYRVVMASPQRELMIQTWKENIAKTFEWGTIESIWPEPPAIERLEELVAPTCFILGEEDVPDLHRIAETFRRVPGIRMIEIAGADHKPMLTHPEELSRHITEFLED